MTAPAIPTSYEYDPGDYGYEPPDPDETRFHHEWDQFLFHYEGCEWW